MRRAKKSGTRWQRLAGWPLHQCTCQFVWEEWLLGRMADAWIWNFLSFIVFTNGLATLHLSLLSYRRKFRRAARDVSMYHPYQDSAERDVIFYNPPTKSLLKEILSFILSTKVLVRQDWSDIRLLSRNAISYHEGPISARSPSLRPTWRHRQFEFLTFTNVTIMRQVMRSLKSAAWSLASLSRLCWLPTVNGLKQHLFILFSDDCKFHVTYFFKHVLHINLYIHYTGCFFTGPPLKND